jgi:hypothetical protein
MAEFNKRPLINLSYSKQTSALTFLDSECLINNNVDLFHQDEHNELIAELASFTLDEDGEDLLADKDMFEQDKLTEDGKERV